MDDADIHLLLEVARRQGLLVQGGAAERHGLELRQDLDRRQGATLDKELGYLLHHPIPGFLCAKPIEQVLDLGEAHVDAPGLALGGLGSGGERGALGLRILASRPDHSVQRPLVSEERPFQLLWQKVPKGAFQ
ncbi:hypothetical protein [Methylobacterium gregans]|uniref:hypothetical protein n=1 Tax=Methylobacterium gregans TaxID=374424 RepID=UPI001EE1D4E2|nr:hypothetical protein [Methylobacterium gregans]MDQ0522437.1 hypothetical protein [Methylobacterium gregans]